MKTEIRSAIRFWLDDKLMTVQDVSPTTTVLNFLRDHLERKGTKEGCAEGDCGACTVVVADLHHGRIRYRPINACIQFLPVLDGKQLYTVESLALNPEELHPIQQAMVDTHASQCGFCTPGFVMSLFALYKNHTTTTREQLTQALSGNLCRCTGYRPILAAGERMYAYAEQLSATELTLINAPCGREIDQSPLYERLAQLQADPRPLALTYGQERYFAPMTLEAFTTLYNHHTDARILAGGTDIGLWVTKQHRDLPTLIYLGNVAELNDIQTHEGYLEIGAAVLLEDAYQVLVQYYPSLQTLYQRFASLPIRSAGTLVGNIANGSPIGDSMPILITLGASVILFNGKNQRELPLEDFYLGYQRKNLHSGEFVQAVKIPLPVTARHVKTYKIAKRFGQDISAVCGAFCMELQDNKVSHIRIAFGGMAAIPQRAHHTEQALLHQAWEQATIEQAMPVLAQDYTPLTDMRASSAYRLSVARNLLLKFYLQTSNPDVATDVLNWELEHD